MSKLVLNLAIDVSGQPSGDVYVGLVSIKTDDINKIMKLFKNAFPDIYRGRKKGARLDGNELKKVIKFLNDNKVFMFCNYISSKEWFDLKNKYKNKANLFERVYALLYFGLIHQVVFKYQPQNLVVDKENYLDINKTLNYFQYLAKSNDYTIITSVGYSSSTSLIKLADLIASASRKIDKKTLMSFNKYHFLKFKDLNYKFINRIFEK